MTRKNLGAAPGNTDLPGKIDGSLRAAVLSAGAAPPVAIGMRHQPSIVVLACSAGGLEALIRVLAPLPPDLPAAVVVVQHQRPQLHSFLAAILARRCRLPVHDVRHGEILREGHVYVVPAGTHALATPAGTLALIASDGPPPYRPSADLLLTSLAVTAGERTIAVILSGGGNDGATGAVAVHEFGGTVLAADETSSAHFAMPAAAIGRDNAVDQILPVDDIAAALMELVKREPENAEKLP